MYKDEYHPQIKKDLKKLDKQVYENIKDKVIIDILQNPSVGEKLTGLFVGLYSFHFKINNVNYRIAYMLNEDTETVYFIKIGKRENFYEELRMRF